MKLRWKPSSLFWTLAGSIFVVLIVSMLLHGVIAFSIFSPLASRWADARAENLVREAAKEIGSTGESPSKERIAEILSDLRPEKGRILLAWISPGGVIVTDRRSPPEIHPGIRSMLNRQEPQRIDRPARRDFQRPPPVRILARESVQSESGPGGEVLAMAPRVPFGIWPRDIQFRTLLFIPLAILLAGATGLIMFRALLRRLHALEELATRVTSGDLDARVEDLSGDEIGRLAKRLNRMTANLSDAKQKIDTNEMQRKRLLGDISHELATPLTSIRGYAETLLNPAIQISGSERNDYLRHILDEAERMDLLIREIMDLTRLEEGAADLQMEKIDWAALCRNTAERFAPQFDEAGIALKDELRCEEAWVFGDGRRLEQVLENLLINTLRHIPSGGSVILSLDPVDAAVPSFQLSVSDDGPGFPPDDLPHVFDRFYRADTSRSIVGSGLGLAIAREIVLRHDGITFAENRSPSGARVTVELPAAPVS